MEDCIYIITGTTRGIGKELKGLLEKNSKEIVTINRGDVDLSNPVDVRIFLGRLELKSKKIVFINNAGLLGPVAPINTIDSTELIECINVNLMSPLLFVNFFASTGLRWKCFNITTGSINTTNKYLGAYSVSKLAFNRYLDFIKLEGQESNCDGVYNYFPPLVDTSMNRLLKKNKFFSNQKFNETPPVKSETVAQEIFKFIMKNSYD